MKIRFVSLWSTLAALLVLPGALRAEERKIVIKEVSKPDAGIIQRIRHIMPPAYEDKLALTNDQRKQIRALDDQFKQKRRDIMRAEFDTIQKIIDDIHNEKETAPAMAIVHEVTGAILQIRHARADFQKKIVAVLDEKQKEQFRELRAQHRTRYVQRFTIKDGKIYDQQGNEIGELKRSFTEKRQSEE
jgi:Spy/CpxP family protein refolding chaperone